MKDVNRGYYSFGKGLGDALIKKVGGRFKLTFYLFNKTPYLFQKGFHLLPALLEHNDFNLVISGIETPHKFNIIKEAEKYNCLRRVHIKGPINDLYKAWYYKNCRAFVFPSIAEGSRLPVIEAMHFGKPVFLSKFTSLPEVGGAAAYYFDNFTPQHMQRIFSEGMCNFKENDRVDQVIKQAELFSWDKASEQYLTLYNECLKAC